MRFRSTWSGNLAASSPRTHCIAKSRNVGSRPWHCDPLERRRSVSTSTLCAPPASRSGLMRPLLDELLDELVLSGGAQPIDPGLHKPAALGGLLQCRSPRSLLGDTLLRGDGDAHKAGGPARPGTRPPCSLGLVARPLSSDASELQPPDTPGRPPNSAVASSLDGTHREAMHLYAEAGFSRALADRSIASMARSRSQSDRLLPSLAAALIDGAPQILSELHLSCAQRGTFRYDGMASRRYHDGYELSIRFRLTNCGGRAQTA